jgi:hypothetical protein
MPTQPFNKYNTFVESLAEKGHNLQSDALVIALSATPQLASFTTLANVVEIAYTGLSNLAARTLTGVTSAQSGGIYKLNATDLVIAATGTAAAFQYVVLYNSTAAAGVQLIGWWDNTTPVSLTSGQNFTVDFDATNGVLQLQ